MAHIIAIGNAKGGSGKTTTALHLSGELSKRGMKVLAIDADQQGNLTDALEHPPTEMEYGDIICQIADKKPLASVALCIAQTPFTNLWLAPASTNLRIAGTMLTNGTLPMNAVTLILRKVFAPVIDDYDYIIVDCPGSSSDPLTVAALSFSDYVLVPMLPEKDYILGYQELAAIVAANNEWAQAPCKVLGCFFIAVEHSLMLHRRIVEAGTELPDYMDAPVQKHADIKNARMAQMPLCYFRPKSRVTENFSDLVDAIQEKIGG